MWNPEQQIPLDLAHFPRTDSQRGLMDLRLCRSCGILMHVPLVSRRVYCSDACRQAQYRKRKRVTSVK